MCFKINISAYFQVLSIIFYNLIICAPINGNKSQPQIIKYSYRHLPNNGYHFIYELSDGQSRDEFGSFDNEAGILRITGIYTYIGEDNKLYTVQYTADENGRSKIVKNKSKCFKSI